MWRFAILVALALCTGSCTFTREIRVFSRGNQLFVDFPWSFWRVGGLQDRQYPCIDTIEVFDTARLLWAWTRRTRAGTAPMRRCRSGSASRRPASSPEVRSG